MFLAFAFKVQCTCLNLTIYNIFVSDWRWGWEGQWGESHVQGPPGQETHLPEADWPHRGDSAQERGVRRDQRVQIHHQQPGGEWEY